MSLPDEIQEALASWIEDIQAAAERDGWAAITDQHGFAPEDALTEGPGIVELLIEAVQFALFIRYMGAVVDDKLLKQGLAFVANQAYGLSDAERSARYSMRLIGPLGDLILFVQELGEVDIDDFQDRYYFQVIDVCALGRQMDAEEVEEVIEAVREDLTFDGNEWELTPELWEKGVLIEFREVR